MLLAVLTARSQTPADPQAIPKREPAIVTSVHATQDARGNPSVEIVTSHPVLPTILMLDSPPRLVVDLANARIGLTKKRTPVLEEDMLTLRAEQYKEDPPITRIVLDLLVTYAYTWDVSGDTLTVRLKPVEKPKAAVQKKSPYQVPQVLSVAPSAAPVAVPVTSGVGEVVLAGKQFAAGSTLTAGSDTAVLRLSRGGDVLVCPRTTVSVTPSKNTRDLMFGMSTGGLETHYAIASSADTVVTPDFRILFAGPGEFDYAISADSQGTTCVRALKGNTSSAIVSELMGERFYQVKPDEQVVFRSGQIDKVDAAIPPECGCPAPVPVTQTDVASTKPIQESPLPANSTLAQAPAPPESAAKGTDNTSQVLSHGPEIRPLPASQPNDVHIQVEAPMVFHGKNGSAAPPLPTSEADALPVMESSSRRVQLDAQVEPPPAAPPATPAKPRRPGVFHRIGKIFSALWQ
jgi:hypothetical protein